VTPPSARPSSSRASPETNSASIQKPPSASSFRPKRSSSTTKPSRLKYGTPRAKKGPFPRPSAFRFPLPVDLLLVNSIAIIRKIPHKRTVNCSYPSLSLYCRTINLEIACRFAGWNAVFVFVVVY